MIELERHIEILLLTNDCVIVPGLGGFMAHYVEAHYDKDDALFLPPLRTLGFNPQLKLNDSLLAQSYIEAYDISYPEAVRRIEEEVEELKQHLYNDGIYELNDIGVLSINEENNFKFEPCESGILSPTLYGLSSFEMKEQICVQESEKPAIEQASIVSIPSTQNSIEEKTSPVDIITMGDDDDDDNSIIKIKVAWIRNAIAVVAAFVSFFFITTPVSNSDSRYVVGDMRNEAILQAMHSPGEYNATTITPKQVKNAIAKHDSTEQSNDTIKAVAARTDSIKQRDVEKKDYCIVLASHITSRNADNYVSELKDKGYNDTYVYKHNNIVRVVYGNYENKAEAYVSLQTIRKNKGFEQAWIYKKR